MTYFYVMDQAIIENMYKPHDKNAFFNLLYICDIVYILPMFRCAKSYAIPARNMRDRIFQYDNESSKKYLL